MDSDIGGLPDELLSSIFLHYVKARDSEGGVMGKPLVSCRARSLLCSVSHRWREVAVTSPQLWAQIQVGHLTPDYPPKPLIRLWIERSRTIPIDVDCYGPEDLTYGDLGDTGSPENAIAMMELLLPDLKRWRSFRVFFLDESAEEFAKLPLDTAYSMEELEVVSSCSQELDDKLLTNINRLPALRRLFWDKYYEYDWDISSFRIAVVGFPWHQLRSITLSVMMSPDEAYDFFSASTSAEEILLKLRRNPDAPVNPTQRPLVTLPNLQSLDIRSDVGMYETLQHLDLPGIKTLRLFGRRYRCNGPNIPCRRYKEFISRAAVSAQFVKLQTLDFSGSDVTEFFENPNLLNIPILDIHLDGDDARERAERALKTVIDAQSDGTPRVPIVKKMPWSDLPYIGWVDQEVRRKCGSGLGY